MSNLFGEGDPKISVLTDDFISNFDKMKSNIEKKLEDAKELSRDDLPAHFDQINSDMQDLMKYFSDSTKFLPHFNVRRALDGAKLLETRIEQDQRELMPKKKFAFKAKTLPQAPEKDAMDCSAQPKAVDVELYDCGFKNLLNQKAEKFAAEINGQDVGLYTSTNSTLYLYGHPSTVHCSKLQNCRIFTGPVATSIFVEECNECTFVVACQQLRVHNTTDSDFYLHVTSRGIIEDCRGLRFAPYNWSYDDIRSDFKAADLDRENNWQQIDDFNWLSKDAPSPNWSVLKDNERRHIWDEI